jgi:parvulin-like peptidyl-prolyl isomerase
MLIVELAQRGLMITDRDVERERDLFYQTLNPDPDVAARLSRELRIRQGLGKRRLNRLLRRNAGLRALVADDVVISEEAVVQTYEVLHGPRRRARLIVLPTLNEAQSAINRLHAGEFFGDIAVSVSTDASASRGGLLAPISRADPTYPEVLRDALWALDPGEVSPPILLDRQYALLKLIDETPGDGIAMEAARDELERQVRLSQERLLMNLKARQLLTEASVTIIDAALKDSWDDRAVQTGPRF